MSAAQDRDYQPKPKVIEHPARDERQGFDLRTHIKDAKTGQLIREQSYQMRVVSGVRYFERNDNPGNLFYESGEAAGRFEDGVLKVGAPHKETAPKQEVTDEQTRRENEELKRELAALKAEKEVTMKPAAEQKKAATQKN